MSNAATSSINNQTVPIPFNGNTITVIDTITTTDTNGYQQLPVGGTFQGPITITGPWVSGGSGSGWQPYTPLTVPEKKKKPRKPRTKKVLPPDEQEMKDAEAKWKKILDGSSRK